jgi:DNA-binding transcriptional LysR family regulator
MTSREPSLVHHDFVKFVALAEELNFRRAAERLKISQPSVTGALQRLELELGVRLLDRGARRSTLTPAGELLLEGTRSALRDAEALTRDVRDVGHGRLHQLRIGAIEPALRYLVPPALAALRLQHPRLSIDLQTLTSEKVVDRVGSGRIDIGLARVTSSPKGIASKIVMHEPLVAVLPAAHASTCRNGIGIDELTKGPFVMNSFGLGRTAHGDHPDLRHINGCVLSETIEKNGLDSQLALIAAGIGVTVQSSLSADYARDDLAFVAVRTAHICPPLQILYRSGDASQLIQEFVQFTRLKGIEMATARHPKSVAYYQCTNRLR